MYDYLPWDDVISGNNVSNSKITALKINNTRTKMPLNSAQNS